MLSRVCSLLSLVSFVVASGAITAEAQSSSPPADILVRGARIVDGTGSPWFRGDLAIRDGRIQAVGNLSGVPARKVIEARERVLAPGFIDVHTHVETRRGRGGIEKLPRADNFLRDGVTTIVTGNCGGSELDLLSWSQRLDGLGLNIATLVGHNSIRRQVMGNANRSSTPEELAEMQALVQKAMDDGAVGFSTGLLYVPGTYASTEEVVALAQVASARGGVYATHIREQGAELHASIAEAVRIGREAKMPVQISHFKVKGRSRWGTIGAALDQVDGFRDEGVDVVIDVYPYERASTSLAVTMPAWALAGSDEEVRARRHEPESRARIIDAMKAMLKEGGYPDYSYATVARYGADPGLEGKTISEINVLAGRPATVDSEVQTILEMMDRGGASMIYHFMSEEDVATILRYPNSAVASDGGVRQPGNGKPHPRSYGTNARVLAEFVRRRQVLSLEEAVRRMTSLPARTFGFLDRGILRPGFVADVVLFDPERVEDEATFQDPHQYSVGFDEVIVNGALVVSGGELTDARPGRFVPRGGTE